MGGRIHRRHVAALLAAGLVSVAASGCGRYFTAGAAVVNGSGISRAAMEDRVGSLLSGQRAGTTAEARTQASRQAIGDLIREELVRQEAARRKIVVTDAEVAARFSQIRDSFPSPAEFQSALAGRGFTEASLRDRIREQILETKFRAALVSSNPVTDADVAAVYARDKATFEEVHVRHILFAVSGQGQEQAALAKARAALAQIRAGADFKTIAKKLSDDKQSAVQGGDLGPVRRGQFGIPEFEQAAFTLKPGKVSEPVRTMYGYHLIRVDSRRIIPLSEVAGEIRTKLESQRADDVFGEWLASAFTGASVIVNPRFGDWDPASKTVTDHKFFVPASPQTEPNS